MGLNRTAVSNSTTAFVVADTVATTGGSKDSIQQPALTTVSVNGVQTPVMAAFEVRSTEGAFLPPRMTQTQLDAMVATGAVTPGMEVFNTTLGGKSTYLSAAAGASTSNLHAVVTLTSAQILALNVTPVTIVPSAGIFGAISVRRVSMESLVGNTAYTVGAGSHLTLQIGAVAVTDDIDGNALLQTAVANTIAFSAGLDDLAGHTSLVYNDEPLQLHTNNAFTLGNGTLRVNVWYDIVAVTAN